MLACIACSKRLNDGSLDAADEDGSGTPRSPASREAIKNLTSQIKDMALKLSGAHKHCRPFTVSNLGREGQLQRCTASEAGSESGTPRGGSSSSTPAWSIVSSSSKGHVLGDKLCASTSRIGTPMLHTSSGPVETTMEVEEESKEWISQVEPGVLITLVSVKGGGNELKRIRFSRELFNKWQAQRWWAENYDKVMELYNVHAHAKEESAVAVPTPPRSDDERDSKRQESGADSPVTPPLQNMSLLPRGLYASRTSSSRYADRSDDFQSSGNSSEQEQEQEQEQEWVEEDEPGVYVTIRCSPAGSREIRRVRFSREKFSEMQARLWWEENRLRIHEQYISGRSL